MNNSEVGHWKKKMVDKNILRSINNGDCIVTLWGGLQAWGAACDKA